MLEVRGREIRTSEVEDKFLIAGITLKTNSQIYLDCANPQLKSNASVVRCSYKDLPRLVKPNDIIYIDDGKIILLVNECEMVSQ